jgi:hypothetical protein
VEPGGTFPGGEQVGLQRPTADGSDRRQRITLARSAPTWDMSGLTLIGRRSRISADPPRLVAKPLDNGDARGQLWNIGPAYDR